MKSVLFLVLLSSWTTLLSCEELLLPQTEDTSDLPLNTKRESADVEKRGLFPSKCAEDCGQYECDDILQCIGNKIFLTPCYCFWGNNTIRRLAHCQFTCFRKGFLIAPNIKSLKDQQCSPFNRTGKFCGDCVSGYGHSVYSFSLKCIACNGTSWINIGEYMLVAYGPLTIFICILFVFRISINTAPLLGFILVAQISSFSFQMRLAVGMIEAGHTKPFETLGIYAFSIVYGIWNLDFFRAIVPEFCVSYLGSIMRVMCLDYIIASYPFLFILMIYITVEGYSRGYRICSWWKPFHWCLSRVKNEMNIKIPLIEAFGTFFSLSYAKTLSTSFDILSTTQEWDMNGKTLSHVPYYAPSEEIFLPYFVIGLAMFIVLNCLPIPVLFIYSLRSAPREASAMETSQFLHPLLNALLIPYKDGQNGTRNLRWFSVVYLIVRILLVVALQVSPTIFFQLVAAIVCLILGMLVAIIRPYKSDMYNTVDTVLILSLSVAYFGILSYFYAHLISPASITIARCFATLACAFGPVCILILIAQYVIYIRKYPQRIMPKMLEEIYRNLKLFRQRRMSPEHEAQGSTSSRGTMYVTIDSDTLRVSNVDLR